MQGIPRGAAFCHHTNQFAYPTFDSNIAVCDLDVFVREDLANQPYWAVVLFTQKQDEPNSLNNDIPAIAMRVLIDLFIHQGMDGITPEKILWLENYPPNAAVRYGRMERVFFREAKVCLTRGYAVLADPIWHRITMGLVEKLMGKTWAQMYLPEIKRYAD